MQPKWGQLANEAVYHCFKLCRTSDSSASVRLRMSLAAEVGSDLTQPRFPPAPFPDAPNARRASLATSSDISDAIVNFRLSKLDIESLDVRDLLVGVFYGVNGDAHLRAVSSIW